MTYTALYDTLERERLRFYFPNTERTTCEYTPAELQFFENMRQKYGHLEVFNT